MKYLSSITNFQSLISILILSLILRLINLNQSLWWDEAINVVYAQGNDFFWFVTKYPIGDFHPPGYFTILWVWGHLFSFSEIFVRLPSVIFGLGTIFITYLIGKELFSKKSGLIAALFLTVAPLHIYYSQEARMYSLAAFAVAFSMYSLIKLVTNQRFGLVLYILSTVLVLYSDYLAYFIIPTQFFWVSIYHKQFLKKFFLSLVLIVFFWSPWLLVFPQQLAGGQVTAELITGWRDVVGGANIRDFLLLPLKIVTGRISFDSNLLYILFATCLALPFVIGLIRLLKSKQDSQVSLLWFWLILPPLLAFLISFWIPVFSYFRFIFILPAFYLLTAAGLTKFKPGLSKTLVVLVVLSGLTASSLYLLGSHFHREDWKGAVNFLQQNADNRTIVLHKNNEIPAAFNYYRQTDINVIPAFKTVPINSKENLKDLELSLNNFDRVYLFNYLVDITDPKRLLENKLQELGFSKNEEYNFRGVGFVSLYVR